MRVLWVTNMFHEDGDAGARGIFVRQQWDAMRATGRVELERELVAQGRGVADYLRANRRVRAHWDRGRFDLVHVHYGLTGLATMMLPTSVPMVFTFYGSDINDRLQRTLSVGTARRAARRIFVANRLASLWPDDRNVVIPNGIDFATCVPRDRTAARVELGLPGEGARILFGAHPG
ncbi:glycosyltransferase, partial [bacterium]|nr:glycosyltransferase [bacterium]